MKHILDEFKLTPEKAYEIGLNAALNLCSEEFLEAEMKRTFGAIIRFIRNPSEKLQLLAVQLDAENIKYIENSSRKIKLAAVKKSWFSIQYIEDPPEEVLLAAVRQNGHAIQFVKNPSLKVQLAAVKKSATAIQYIKDPSEEVQLSAAARQTVPHLVNPTDRAIRDFLQAAVPESVHED